MADKTVAISYSRKHEAEGEAKGTVAKLVEAAHTANARVVWDGNGIQLGQSLRAFMRDLARSDVLVVFLSDEYLRSVSCMYELLTAWQTCKDDPGKFRSQVRVWVMSNAKGIFRPEDRLPVYTSFWLEEASKAKAALGRADIATIGEEALKDLKTKVEIGLHCDSILGFVADSLSPKTFDEFHGWVSKEFPAPVDKTERLPTHEEIRNAFGAVYVPVNRILRENKELRALLAQKFQLIPTEDEDFTDRLILHLHAKFLDAVGTLSKLYEESQEKKGLLELVSSVLFLAMAPEAAATMHQSAHSCIVVSDKAGQGILDILSCWVQNRTKTVLRASSKEKPPGRIESSPAMGYQEIKLSLMLRLNIDPRAAGADDDLAARLEVARNFHEAEILRLPAHDRSLIQQIKEPNSPLRDLLVFVTVQGQSLNPRAGKNYDHRLELHLEKIQKVFNP